MILVIYYRSFFEVYFFMLFSYHFVYQQVPL